MVAARDTQADLEIIAEVGLIRRTLDLEDLVVLAIRTRDRQEQVIRLLRTTPVQDLALVADQVHHTRGRRLAIPEILLAVRPIQDLQEQELRLLQATRLLSLLREVVQDLAPRIREVEVRLRVQAAGHPLRHIREAEALHLVLVITEALAVVRGLLVREEALDHLQEEVQEVDVRSLYSLFDFNTFKIKF